MTGANLKEYITPKLGGMCWHRFLAHVKVINDVEEEVADLKEAKDIQY